MFLVEDACRYACFRVDMAISCRYACFRVDMRVSCLKCVCRYACCPFMAAEVPFVVCPFISEGRRVDRSEIAC